MDTDTVKPVLSVIFIRTFSTVTTHNRTEHFGSYLLCGVSGCDNGNCPIVTDKMYMKPLSVEHGTLILRVVGSSPTLVAKFM